jgi:proline dehydrogenase
MVSERKRAQEMGYESPIHDEIEATHECYDGSVRMALEAMARGEKVEVLVASHNQVGAFFVLGGG